MGQSRRRRTALGAKPTVPVGVGDTILVVRDGHRVPAIDALRGAAVLAMIAFHFCFDLANFRLVSWNFYRDAFWLNARTGILSSFLLIAGVSLVLADSQRPVPRAFWRHVGVIAGCAALVSLGSYVVFPQSFIWFGVLHAIAVSLVLARPLVRQPWLALAVGAAVILAGNLVANPAFDSRTLGWLGFATTKPHTEDYVPLFPWSGGVLVGIALGHALRQASFRPVALAARLPRWIAWLGRHSLVTYMIHQPILLGILYLAVGR
jgi:uncharacterized membrane protein